MSNYLFRILLILLTGMCYGQSRPTAPPNVVLIMADDLGYGDLGCYGSTTVATPHLDTLATRGIRFTDYHSNAPVCTPTRAALLTGRYPQRVGLEGVIYVKGDTRQVGLDTTTLTWAKLLKRRGYATGIVGKWHLGYQKEYNPVHHGFNTFYGYISGNIDYHSHYDNASIYDWWHNLDTIREEGYVTDLITQHATDFIEQHRDEPFFLYVAHEAPHAPFQGRNDPAFRSADTTAYFGPVANRQRAYREMVEVLDEGVGEIMQTLRKNGLEENTLVLFVSDNGAISEYGDNGELSGEKGELLEGGHRVPAIAYWKNQITPRTSSATLMSMDLLPTVLSLTSTEEPAEASLDGVDAAALLLKEQSLAERPLFWRYRGQKVVRENQWKLLITDADTVLYDLDQDKAESINRYDTEPSIVEYLRELLTDWESEVDRSITMKTR